jgi:hypothetical protein
MCKIQAFLAEHGLALCDVASSPLRPAVRLGVAWPLMWATQPAQQVISGCWFCVPSLRFLHWWELLAAYNWDRSEGSPFIMLKRTLLRLWWADGMAADRTSGRVGWRRLCRFGGLVSSILAPQSP